MILTILIYIINLIYKFWEINNMLNEAPLGTNIITGKPYTVMVIDDSSTIRVAEKKILLSEGFDVVVEAESGADALAKLKSYKESPDIILLDFEMPNMNGLDLLKSIRSLGITSKVIVVTSYSDRGVLTGFLKLGVNGYVVKPIERRIMIDHLAKVIGRDDYVQHSI